MICLSFFIFFLCLFSPQPLSAIMSGQIGIKPAYPDPAVPTSIGRFDYSLAPSETKEDAVEVINTYDKEIVLKIYSVGATTTPDGIFALGMEEVVEDVGTWIKLSKNEVTLAPYTSEIVPFTFTVPADAEPGDHMGGIVIQEKEVPKGEGSITIITRVGVRIYERVPGEIIRGIEITGFNWEFMAENAEELKKVNFGKLQSFLGFRRKVHFSVGLHNQGTIREELKSNVTVTNMFGKEIADFDTENGMIFPKKDVTVNVNWLKEGSFPLFGRYTAKVAVTYEKDLPPVEAELAFWAIPYSLFVLIGILIALGVLIYLNRLLIKELAKKEMVVYIVRPGDSLGSIAQRFDVKWKKLAKINNIKKPYHLKPESYLFVPQGSILNLFLRQLIRKKRVFWIVIIIAAIIAIVLGGWIYYQYQSRQKSDEANQQEEQNQSIEFQPTAEESRDQTRKEDLKKIQSALEQFYQSYQRYPLASELSKTNQAGNILDQELVAGGFMAELPKDPQEPTYYYGYRSDGQTYELTSILENGNDPEAISISGFFIYKITSPKQELPDSSDSETTT